MKLILLQRNDNAVKCRYSTKYSYQEVQNTGKLLKKKSWSMYVLLNSPNPKLKANFTELCVLCDQVSEWEATLEMTLQFDTNLTQCFAYDQVTKDVNSAIIKKASA